VSNRFCQDLKIPCSAGLLEGRLSYREENNGRPGVILCPPHPLLAGNMDNNVIKSLSEILSKYYPILTFNYRGVGRSFKAEADLPLFEYWNKLDASDNFSEIITDTKQVIEWSKRLFTQYHLVGYSFGSFIALSAISKDAESFTAITPPLVEHEFSGLEQLRCAILMLFSGNDSLLSPENRNLNSEVVSHIIEDCDHFFIGREGDVSRLVKRFLLSK
jgi:alpha/beta superfamily hydrolase